MSNARTFETPEARSAWLKSFPQTEPEPTVEPTAPAEAEPVKRPAHAGQVVADGKGRIGIVTEEARRAGIYKGLLGVMWVGGRYEVTEDPDGLTVIPAADLMVIERP